MAADFLGLDPVRAPAPVREPDDEPRYRQGVTSGDYLRFPAARGYALGPVKEVVTGVRSRDEVYDECADRTDR